MDLRTIARAPTFALRELRSGLAGFRIYAACLALGVVAVVAVGSLSEAFLRGLAEQGRVLLGGDVAVTLVHRPTTRAEGDFLSKYGRVSQSVSMRAMAYAIDAHQRLGERQLIELKAVDKNYPLFGTTILAPAAPLASALTCNDAECGAVAEQTLLDRLHIDIGKTIRVGAQNFRIKAILQQEPDRISAGFSLGPHILIATAALPRTQLVQTGSLINYAYRVALRHGDPKSFKAKATAQFPDAGWEIRTRDNAAPGIVSFVEQVTMFLMLIGLTVLAIAGVGAAQAIYAYLDRKQDDIAILKSLGADGATIFLVYFLQVMTIALGAIVGGVVVGVAVPFCVEWLYGRVLPLPARFEIYGAPIGLGIFFAALSAIAFSVLPLARVRSISPANLFRDLVAPAPTRVPFFYVAVSATCGVLVIAATLLIAPSPARAAEFLAGAIALVFLFRLIATGLRRLLMALPRPELPLTRLALANLTRPGSQLANIVTALGLGLSLLAAITLLDRTVSAQVNDALPERAPTFFFVDIQPDEIAAFDRTVLGFHSASSYKRSPMIRGRIVALNGVPSSQIRASADSRWVFAGDRGITYASTAPEGTEVTAGRWWPSNYAGPTLISFDGDLAPGLGIKLGDTITLNVLGRSIEGRVSNFRHVNFRSGQQNFILILSPGVIDKAPHSFLATVRVAPAEEEPLYRAVTDRFANISVVRVRESIAQVNDMLQRLAIGIQASTLVTILAGMLVLGGAIAASGRARLYDATILKVLGATRTRILAAYALEYGFLGLLTSTVALVLGCISDFAISRWILDVPFLLDVGAASLTIGLGAGVTLFFGLVAAWGALSARPIERLRAP